MSGAPGEDAPLVSLRQRRGSFSGIWDKPGEARPAAVATHLSQQSSLDAFAVVNIAGNGRRGSVSGELQRRCSGRECKAACRDGNGRTGWDREHHGAVARIEQMPRPLVRVFRVAAAVT